MQIKVSFDVSKFQAVTLRQQKRLAYTVSEALNKTALAIQGEIRADMARAFQLRRTTKRDRRWLLEQVKVSFASPRKGQIFAEIYLDTKPRLLLSAFELGEQRQPFVGKSIAVPVYETAREGGSKAGAVKQELTFKDLKMKPITVAPVRAADTIQFKGLQRTFLLKSTAQHPLGAIYQRTGPGKDDIRIIYSFHRAFQLKKLVHLFETAKKLYAERFRKEMAIASAGQSI